MPCLPHDPSIYVDDCAVPELVAEFSLRLRRSVVLRDKLNLLVGNHWFELEQGLVELCGSVILQQPSPEQVIDAFFDHVLDLSPADLAELADVFLETCLAIFPLHAAASINELFERAKEVVENAYCSQRGAGGREQARIILKAGHIFR